MIEEESLQVQRSHFLLRGVMTFVLTLFFFVLFRLPVFTAFFFAPNPAHECDGISAGVAETEVARFVSRFPPPDELSKSANQLWISRGNRVCHVSFDPATHTTVSAVLEFSPISR